MKGIKLEQLFHRKWLLVMIFGLLMLMGIYSMYTIPKQTMPDMETPYISLTIETTDLSIDQIDSMIVRDVEQYILSYKQVESLYTSITYNEVNFSVIFSYDANDLDKTAVKIVSDIKDLLTNSSIVSISYQFAKDDPDVMYVVHSDDANTAELENFAEMFKQKLLTNENVKSVLVYSPIKDNIIIEFDLEKLTTKGFSLGDVYNSLLNDFSVVNGKLKLFGESIVIEETYNYDNLEAINDIVIQNDPIVYLKDVASVYYDYDDVIYVFNDENAIFMSITLNSGIDQTKMKSVIAQFETDTLNNGNDNISLSKLFDRTEIVGKEMMNVLYSLLAAIFIVMLVVLLGTGFKNSMIVISTIPIIIFGSIAVLDWLGYTMNKLTIVGLIISIGIIVDNSIVISERTKHYIENGFSPQKSAMQSIRDNITSILTSTLTTMAAFFVVLLLPGFLGIVVRGMPVAVLIALTISFLSSIFVTPLLAAIFYKHSGQIKRKRHNQWIKSFVKNALKHPRIWPLLALTLSIGTTAFVLTNHPIDLYPTDSQSIVYIDVVADDINSALQNIDDTLSEIDTYQYNAKSINGAFPHFHFSEINMPTTINSARVFAVFDESEKSFNQTVGNLETKLNLINNASITVHRLEWSPPCASLSISLKAESLHDLPIVETNLEEFLQGFNDFTYQKTAKIDAPLLNISFNQTQMNTYNVTKEMITEFLTPYLNELEINENISATYNMQDLSTLLSTTITTDFGDLPIGLFINVTMINEPAFIYRVNGQYTSEYNIFLNSDVNVNDLKNDIDNVLFNVSDKVNISYTDEFEMFRSIQDDLIKSIIIAFILIFIILFAQFNDAKQPFMILLTIPIAFGGGFLFLLLFNNPITATGLVGLISLMGVTVNNGILLAAEFKRNQEQMEIKDAVVEGVATRFRPVLMTSLTTTLGLIPLYISGGSFFETMALMFMGGMLFSTFITLFLVPCIYVTIKK